MVPYGSSGKDYINLLAEWLNHLTSGNTFQGIAMDVFMTLPNLLLQKPSAKSKGFFETG